MESNISLSNMHAFDAQGLITKYDSPEEIMAAHHDVRLEAYCRRKQQQERTFAAEELQARHKSQFILDIVSGSISITSGQRGSSAVNERELVEELRRRSFPSSVDIERVRSGGSAVLPDSGSESAGGAADDSVDKPSGRRSAHGFDYLLGMPIHSLTEERSVALSKAAEEALAKLRTSQALSERDLWLADLRHLENKYAELFE